MAKTLRDSVMESAGWMHACATKRNARPSPTDERHPYCIWLFRIEVRVVQGLDSLLESTDEVPSPSPTASNPNPPCSPGLPCHWPITLPCRKTPPAARDGSLMKPRRPFPRASADSCRRGRSRSICGADTWSSMRRDGGSAMLRREGLTWLCRALHFS
ncbi:hypothetical protein CPAR01_10839 [Colletotrichum paranaense]|uniref:Uncharacterized protein n=1 Tax=Colletotrichum paranaense TaxID=1914294 RepID=A0ABQ9SB88_9PEZI|nr:uncharacterized protein CPAR01_10839 [Colletotrichum paranaense]KAK1531190.1 hypothetical protein CPAR01_10839 [Colletotrichum paranaense]